MVNEINFIQNYVIQTLRSLQHLCIYNQMIFFDDPAGRGKTFNYSTVLHTIRIIGEDVIPVTSLSIATTVLLGRITAHSNFKFPFDINTLFTCNLKPNMKKTDMLLKVNFVRFSTHGTCLCFIDF